MTNNFKPIELFGGAIITQLPASYTDVSTIREVPDHQEIYLDATGFSSIIIEIAERVTDPATDQEALKFHFQDILDENDTSQIWQTDVAQLPHFPNNIHALTPKFVAIIMTLIRLEPQSTDIVVTVNIPHIPGHQEYGDDMNFEEGKFGRLVEEGVRVRDEVWKSLEVRDWGLFGG
ncbi:MAG: hypothetical protein Q9186_000015 [Xanthomendoza sp. 1 TL-2023]